MKRVVLIDDHQVFLESFKLALSQGASFDVVGEATTARAAYGLIETLKPDLVVVDLMLKDTDGIAVAREIARRRVKTRLFILTMHSNALFVGDAFDAGVQGYALKDEPLEEVIRGMQLVADGQAYVSPALGSVPSPRVRGSAQADIDGLLSLTRREREIFCRIIDGQNSRDIAESLSISIKTVETHRSHINRKLGVKSPAELIRLAAFKGLFAAQSLPRSSESDEIGLSRSLGDGGTLRQSD